MSLTVYSINGVTPVVDPTAYVHPSAVLRAPERERAGAERRFFADVERVARHMR